MIEYQVDGVTYGLDYQALREKHLEFCRLKDKEFRERLPEALHVACIISYLKGLPNNMLVSDRGIIHMIAHQIHIPMHTGHEFKEMRKSFKKVLALSL